LLIRRARKLYSECDLGLDLKNTVYALDSTTIDLCLSSFEWASFRSTKAAARQHPHVYSRERRQDGRCQRAGFDAGRGRRLLRDGPLLSGFLRLYKMHQAGAFFVTRAKRGMDARRVYSAPTDRSSGVICDQRIALNGFYPSKGYPEQLRRIRFNDQKLDKTLVFLTNNTVLPPLTIAALYKSRWQVELFFTWIKQHLRIKKFLGTSENAVKTQIWCAVSTYVLIAIIKKELKLEASLYNILQISSISVFEKTLSHKHYGPNRSTKICRMSKNS
jgi:hypothetical protein